MLARILRAGAVLPLVFAASLSVARPSVGLTTFYVDGTIKNSATGAGIADACVVFGPAIIVCATHSDANGYYRIDASAPDLPGAQWEVNSVKAGYTNGHQAFTSDGTSGHYIVSLSMTSTAPAPPPPPAPPSGTPTQLVYLPNITKTLGGPSGWQTPFIVQNVGNANTDLEVDFYRFSDGSPVTRRIITALKPGTSFADVPNNDTDLPGDTQFSVVVRSFGANVDAVVNEHAGSGARAEAGSYVGASQGATSVFLPNIVKRFFGFDTPFITQNLGASSTTATASFLSFDGTKIATITRTIAPGQSQFINPDAEPALVNGTQYAVTVSASQPLSVVVNTHRDAPEIGAPVMYG